MCTEPAFPQQITGQQIGRALEVFRVFLCPHAKTEPCRGSELGAVTSLPHIWHFPLCPSHAFPATPQFHMVLEYPAEPEPHF